MTPIRSTFRARDDIRRHWAVYLALVLGLAIWCAADVARRAIVDPDRPWLHMTDFTVYTAAGAAFYDGREPYDVANIRGWKYLYPPLFALLIAPLGALSPPWQATVWFSLCALMAFGCYFECRRWLAAFINPCRPPLDPASPWRAAGCISTDSRSGQTQLTADSDRRTTVPPARSADSSTATSDVGFLPGWLFAAALLAALFPALNSLQRGQMGLALVYPLLLGFRMLWLGTTPTAWIGGGILLALPVALKLTPALPAGCALATLLVAAITRRGYAGSPARYKDTPGDTGARQPAVESVAPRSSLIRSVGQIPACATGRAVWGTAGLIVGSVLFFLVLPATLVGWSANLRHLGTWYVRVASRVEDVRADDFGGDVASFRNQSLHNAVYRCGNWVAHQFLGGPDDLSPDVRQAAMPMDAPIVSRLLSATRAAALLALAAVVVAAGRSGNPLMHGVAFGLAGVATLVVSPVSRGHYFVFWWPAVALVPLWFRQIGRPRWAVLFSSAPAVLTVAHYVFLPYAGRVGLLGLGTALWYFATCGSMWLCREAGRATPGHVPSVRSESSAAIAA